MNKHILDPFRAELIKLKSTPILYLMAFCWVFVCGIVLLANVLDVHNRVSLDVNPWDRFLLSAMAIFCLFVLSPLSTFLVSALMHIEQKADIWKYIYTTPTKRAAYFLSKLTILLAILGTTTLIMLLLLCVTGYLVDKFYPEYEFAHYRPDLHYLFSTAFRGILSCLGIVGLQYFMSTLSRSFLLPVGIGILGFIVGFILSTANTKISLFFPYAYPLVAQDFGSFSNEHRKTIFGEWLTNMECYSVAYFILFVAIGYLYEFRRSIS